MTEQERRLDQMEQDIRTLYRKENNGAIAAARMETTIDSINMTLGRLEAAITNLQAKPSKWLEKIVQPLICGVISLVVALVMGVIMR